MAYIPNTEDELTQNESMNVLDQNQQQQQGQMQQGQQDVAEPIQVASATAAAPAVTPQQAQQTAQQGAQQQQAQQQAAAPRRRRDQPRGSGLFTDIRKYVEANRPQAARIREAVTQDVEQRSGTIAQDVAARQERLQQDLERRAQEARSLVEQQVAQAGQQGFDPQNLATFEDIREGQFNVAANVTPENFTREQARANELQRLAGLARTGEGREELLRRVFQDGDQYTRGQQQLDALILQGSPDEGARLTQEVGQTAQQFGDLVTQARRQSLENLANKVQGQADLQEFATGAVTGAEEELRQVLAQRETEREQQAQAFAQRIAAGREGQDLALTFADLQELGLEEGQRLYGIDPTEFLAARDFTTASLATEEERARAEALAQLAGVETQRILDDPSTFGSDTSLLTGREALQQELARRAEEESRLSSLIYSRAAFAGNESLGRSLIDLLGGATGDQRFFDKKVRGYYGSSIQPAAAKNYMLRTLFDEVKAQGLQDRAFAALSRSLDPSVDPQYAAGLRAQAFGTPDRAEAERALRFALYGGEGVGFGGTVRDTDA